MRDSLTDDIRQTLHAAADRIDVVPPPFGELGARPPAARHAAPRWVWPLAAAAAVVAVALVVVALVVPAVDDDHAAAAATRLTISDGVADVGGVRFRVPAGWTVAVTSTTDDAVTACVASAPAADCDGVKFRISVPDRAGAGTPLTNSMEFEPQCVGTAPSMIRIDESLSSLSGRPAYHYWSYCGPAGPEKHLWQLTDMTLEITTPAGRWSAEGATVAAGLDLSMWPVNSGEVRVFVTEATSSG